MNMRLLAALLVVASAPDIDAKELNAQAGGVKISAAIVSGDVCRSAESWQWGAENRCPQFIIEKLDVFFGVERIFIPLSVFADLGNPHKLSVELHPDSAMFSIVVVGGDAATSYTATIDFKSGHVSKRTVRSGEFPDDSYEETVYKLFQ